MTATVVEAVGNAVAFACAVAGVTVGRLWDLPPQAVAIAARESTANALVKDPLSNFTGFLKLECVVEPVCFARNLSKPFVP